MASTPSPRRSSPPGCSSIGPYDSPDPAVVETYEHERGLGACRNEINDLIANAMGGESGNAGLFAPARDVAHYGQTLLADADASGASRLLAAPTVDCLPVDGAGRTPPHRGTAGASGRS